MKSRDSVLESVCKESDVENTTTDAAARDPVSSLRRAYVIFDICRVIALLSDNKLWGDVGLKLSIGHVENVCVRNGLLVLLNLSLALDVGNEI